MPITPSEPTVCFVDLMAYHIFSETSTIPTGGAEVALHELAPTIGPHTPTTIITGDFGQKHQSNIRNTTLLSSLKLTQQNPFTQFLKFWHALREARADIYIEITFGKTVFFTWLFCKLYNKKFVYETASDKDCDAGNIRTHLLFGQLFKIALEHADQIIVSVKHHEALLRKNHPNISCPITYIPHGMKSPQQQASQQSKNSILWLARCSVRKNPELFIELAKQFPNEQFIMIASPQHNQQQLFERMQTLATHVPNLTFIPGIHHQQAQHYFENAKISVNTSDFEGFSMAFMQSGFAGTPILALNLNPDNIITTYNLGYCAHGDFNLMKQQLHALLGDSAGLQKKSHNIRTYMHEHYDIQIITKQWLQLFAEMFAS